jgi:hypothetical protein
MRNLTATICLMIAVLVGSAGMASALPPCPSDQTQRYHNCFGTYTSAKGAKSIGEWKDGNLHGQGTRTRLNGNKYVGEWKDGKFNGQGTFTFASGKIQKGMFKNGSFVGKGFAHAKSIDSIDISKFKISKEYSNFSDGSCENGKKEFVSMK